MNIVQLSNVGDFNAAVGEYTKALELDPGNFKAWFNRGLRMIN